MAFRDCAKAAENKRARSPGATTATVYHLRLDATASLPIAGSPLQARGRRRSAWRSQGPAGSPKATTGIEPVDRSNRTQSQIPRHLGRG